MYVDWVAPTTIVQAHHGRKREDGKKFGILKSNTGSSLKEFHATLQDIAILMNDGAMDYSPRLNYMPARVHF